MRIRARGGSATTSINHDRRPYPAGLDRAMVALSYLKLNPVVTSDCARRGGVGASVCQWPIGWRAQLDSPYRLV
jgi:hypothetical protein